MFDTVPSMTTVPAVSSTTALSRPLAWQLVFDGVWVARRDGRFAGMVQCSSGDVYKLTDAHGNVVDTFTTLGAARSELQSGS